MAGKKRKIVTSEIAEAAHLVESSKPRSPFTEGAIVRIKLENFITYDAVEFQPGPNLNVIIGPNGTGKSTIVCAICLGLAGKSSILGRAHQSSEFIKHGCDRALIEIELYNADGENWIIKREIMRNNTSQWTVNTRAATQRAVEETVGRLNIQVGNLCQFLPQDKVADFAKMSQQELLENTEKAVGPPDMHENHCRLKTARDRARDLDIQYRRTKEQLEREQALNSRLEQDVRNYEEREKHLKRIKVLKMKRPWVEYDEKRSEYVKQKEASQKLTEAVRRMRAENAPMREKLDSAHAHAKEFDAQSKRTAEQIKEHAKKALANSKEIEEQTDKIIEIQEEMVFKKRDEAQRCQRLADLTEQLRLLQTDLANLEEQEDVQPAIERVVRNIMKTTHEMAKVHRRGEDLRTEIDTLKRDLANIQTQLQQVQDISNRRLEQLRRRDRDTHTAVLWLRANQHLFRATIHEPMMLIINVHDARYAKFVESAISYNDMRAFVCEDGADMELFLKTMSDDQGLRVNAVKMPQQPLESFMTNISIDQYRQYGFFSYLKDLFDCPDAVMRYLCLMYRAHMIPVGTRDTKNKVERIIRENPKMYNFYTEFHQYNIKRSRYGNKAVSSRCTELKSPQLLTVTLDVVRKTELEQQLAEREACKTEKEEEYRSQQQALHDLEQKLHQLRNDKKNLMEKKDMRRILTQKITTKQGSIQTLESMACDVATEERRTIDKVSRIVHKKCTLVADFRDEIQHCWKLGMEKVRISLRFTAAQQASLSAEAELRESSVALQSLERDYENGKEVLRLMKEQARQLLLVAQKAANISHQEDLPPELQKAFTTCPTTLALIDDAIHQEQARADCTSHSDKSVVTEYHNRKAEIAHLEKEVDKKKSVLKKHSEDIETIKKNWLPPLQDLISKINTNFSHFFKVMGNAGEVDLKIPESEDDYEKYGVCIKVKYRDSEQLQELTPHHQSGGERSVATVLYMMSLQELTRCPFRCVDEINQGMDPRNERKIFELVSKTACTGNSSQYFMLTPKLLPDLEYSDDLTLLCVFNGPQMLSHMDWKFKKFLHRRARLA